jgi:hypothetical protein
MSSTELAWRSLHDLGLASWFGGSVFGTVALPHTDDGSAPSSAPVRELESETWRRWSPVVTGSMAAHLVGGVGLLLWNRGRHRHQKGVATTSAVRTALTVTAVALTLSAAAEGYASEARRRKLAANTGDDKLRAQQARAETRMRVVGPLIPATTGALVVLGALEGEQQRPREMVRGIVSQALDDISAKAADVLPTRKLDLTTRTLDALPGR